MRPIRHPSVAVRKRVILRNATSQSWLGLHGTEKNSIWMGSRSSKTPEMALSAQVWLWVGTACQEGLASPVRSSYVPLLLLGWGKWGRLAGRMLGASLEPVLAS